MGSDLKAKNRKQNIKREILNHTTPVQIKMETSSLDEDEINYKIPMTDQLALNLSKMNENSQMNNIRIIKQLDHKLKKQKEVNRDLRVEKDTWALKLEETEKQLHLINIR